MGVYAAVIVAFLIGVCFGVFGCAFWYLLRYEFPHWRKPDADDVDEPRVRRSRA